jgi:hypothetical protein
MAEIGGSSSGNSLPPQESVAEQTRSRRESYITNKNGDAVGNNWVAPKGDFAHFLGYKQATPQEASGDHPTAGSRVIELALQKEASELGMGAAKHGNSYRNQAISWGRYNGEPGREGDMLKDGIDSIRASAEHNSMESKHGAEMGKMSPASQKYIDESKRMQRESHNDNVKYLEMQYRFQEMGKQEGIISNLMKTRSDNVSRMIRGSGGGG